MQNALSTAVTSATSPLLQVVTYFDKIKGIAPPASPWQAAAAGVTVQGPTGSAVL